MVRRILTALAEIAVWARIVKGCVTDVRGAVVAVFVLATLIMSILTQQSVVSAEAVLQKAVEHERVQQLEGLLPGRVHIRFTGRSASRKSGRAVKDFSLTRDVSPSASIGTTVLGPIDHNVAEVIATVVRAGLDWDSPLSAARLQAWRDSLPRKRDEVTTEDGLTTLRTTTDAGIIREALLVLAPPTYDVRRLSLILEDVGRLEIVTIAAPTTGAARVPSSVAPMMVVDPHVLLESELDARLIVQKALGDIKNDLHVSPGASAMEAQSAVRVTGVLASEPMRRRVTEQLAPLSHVEVAIHVAPYTPAWPWGEPSPAFAARLKRTVRGADARERLFDALVRLTIVVRRGVDLRQELATRYSTAETRKLTRQARAKLQSLLDAHHRDLNRDLDALEVRLAVLTGSRSRHLASPRIPVDWRRRSTAASEAADTLSEQIQQLFTANEHPIEQGLDDHLMSVSETFMALWEAVNAFEQR